MTRILFLKLCAFGFINAVHNAQDSSERRSSLGANKHKAEENKGDDWQEVWRQIDLILSNFADQMSAQTLNLYIEKGNFATRTCPINAYLVLANPAHGDIAQMVESDMVSISVDFCYEGGGVSVVAMISKGVVVSHFRQAPILVSSQGKEARREVQDTLVKINDLLQQSARRVHELLV